MKSQLDLSIIGSSPVIRKAVWMGKYQLEYGKRQHADSWYKKKTLSDTLSWFQLFPSAVNYEFFQISDFIVH
jgi:hypothetical protein